MIVLVDLKTLPVSFLKHVRERRGSGGSSERYCSLREREQNDLRHVFFSK
jgi:hypothetical protein